MNSVHELMGMIRSKKPSAGFVLHSGLKEAFHQELWKTESSLIQSTPHETQPLFLPLNHCLDEVDRIQPN
ncbi:hypothetical protein Q8A67_004247 [Cirrhinus molitorella]|uniref:Uncharacterized protein n=1 Tax=Cirrhinus molitorella TaxID=172907 RepID=A0AA88Q9H0_9TELE|nr:hypothetical protein Q8A67_004247 [Cirrhinus molitorella]